MRNWASRRFAAGPFSAFALMVCIGFCLVQPLQAQQDVPSDKEVKELAKRRAAEECKNAIFKKDCRKAEAQTLQAANEIDKIFPLALKEGKAVVVIATLDMGYKYPDAPSWENNRADHVTDTGTSVAVELGTTVEWRNIAQSDKKLIVGEGRPFAKVGGSGFLLELPGKGPVKYQVYIVDPGTYRLSRITHPMPRTSLPVADGTASIDKSYVGSIDLTETIFNETKFESQWFNEQWSTRPPYQECAVVHVTAGCVELRWVYGEEYISREAGYYDVSVAVPAPGLNVDIGINGEFASFSVQASEAIVVDGFFPQPPNTRFSTADCEKSDAKSMVCDIEAVDLLYLQASADVLHSHDYSTIGMPRFNQILGKAQLRPLDVKARPVSKSGLGAIYQLAAN
jgi:hypothetical protein